MARVAGINIPDNKHAEISLTYIFGVGKTRALEICSKTGIAPTAKIGDLKEEELEAIRNEVKKFLTLISNTSIKRIKEKR